MDDTCLPCGLLGIEWGAGYVDEPWPYMLFSLVVISFHWRGCL